MLKYFTLLTVLYYPFYIVFYLIKRVFFLLFYPIPYLFRDKITKEVRSKYDYKAWGKTKIYSWHSKPKLLWYLLWLVLDDSCYFEKHGNGEYFEYLLPEWLKKKKGKFWEFIKAYYWGSLRNNAVNLSRVMTIKNYKGVLLHIGNKHNFFQIKEYRGSPYYAPYFQFYFYGTDIRLKAGWLTNGKYEMSIRKKLGRR